MRALMTLPSSSPDAQRAFEFDLFVSHATKDREFVEAEIVRPLQAEGIRCWYSAHAIQTTDVWPSAIKQGLESSEWFLVVMSPRSAQSEWVRREVHWASEHRQERIITVLLEDCSPYDIHLCLGEIQYVDYRSARAEAWCKLLAALGRNGDGRVPPEAAVVGSRYGVTLDFPLPAIRAEVEWVPKPQVEQPRLPPIPNAILDLEGRLEALEQTVRCLAEGTHPSLEGASRF
ncbi:MAG TPA: toll/interleukin-1 receptor domain-containing protein [Gemmataceae bacterium]|nr:toll/interleukin-1 receptor domain-containing protein [Gemmataceae bacterium]